MSFNEMFLFLVGVCVVMLAEKKWWLLELVVAHALETVVCVCSWDAPATNSGVMCCCSPSVFSLCFDIMVLS